MTKKTSIQATPMPDSSETKAPVERGSYPRIVKIKTPTLAVRDASCADSQVMGWLDGSLTYNVEREQNGYGYLPQFNGWINMEFCE